MKFINIAVIAGAVSAYRADDKIKVDLYYEAQCPYCRDQLVNNFWTAYNTEGFSDMAVVNILPYGNAHESQSDSGNWVFSCQHGPTECTWNTLEACALDKIDDAFPFIHCIEQNNEDRTAPKYDDIATTCAGKAGVSDATVGEILTCYKGDAGNALQHKYA